MAQKQSKANKQNESTVTGTTLPPMIDDDYSSKQDDRRDSDNYDDENDDDSNDNNSQDMALCEVLGLTSLTTITMDDDHVVDVDVDVDVDVLQEDEKTDGEDDLNNDEEKKTNEQQQQYQHQHPQSENRCYEDNQWRRRKNSSTPSPSPSPSSSSSSSSPPSRRIPLPNSKFVSRHGHHPEDCFAWVLPNVFSKEECQHLIDTVEGRTRRRGDDTGSKKNKMPFTYVTTASTSATTSSTAASNQDSYNNSSSSNNNNHDSDNTNVQISKPNPHKLAVFHHPTWVGLIWDRISSKLLFPTKNIDDKTTTTTTTTTKNGCYDDTQSSSSSSPRGDLVTRQNHEYDSENENTMLQKAFQAWLSSGEESSFTSGHTNNIPQGQEEEGQEEEEEGQEQRGKSCFFLPKPVGLNPRLRVLKYDAVDGDEFQPHFDKTTTMKLPIKSKVQDFDESQQQHHQQQQQQSAQEQTSAVTVLLYLNDGDQVDFDGGETVFLSNTIENQRRSAFVNSNKNTTSDAAVIPPSAGTVVLFEHDLYHCGNPLEWGTKYVLRTDIMFPMSQEELLDAHERKSSRQRRNRSGGDGGCRTDILTDLDEDEEPRIILTVQDLVHQLTSDDDGSNIDDESGSNVISMPTKAFKDGLSMLGLWEDTSIESFCLPGRFALQAMLQDVLLVPKHSNTNKNQDEEGGEGIILKQRNGSIIRDINHLLGAAFDVLKQR